MKKLYRKGTVHPSPPNKLDQLNFLPAAILTLAAALSPEEKEVLAYLISCSYTSGNSFLNHHQHPRSGSSSSSSSSARNNNTGIGDHPPSFKCDCFRCYMSYWARWDSSPNRQLIHEIIEAFEDWLVQSSKSGKSGRKDRKKKGIDSNSNRSSELKRSQTGQNNELGESDSVVESSSSGGGDGGGGGGGSSGGDGGEGEGEEKGSVWRMMNYIGERVWGVWGSSI